MGKGRAALTYLPATEIAFTPATVQSVESIKAAIYKVADMQDEGTADGTYNNEVCRTNSPFSSATWNIVVAAGNVAGDYQLTFVSEEQVEISTIGRPALSTRRKINLALTPNGNEFTVRSLLAVVSFIEDLEDLVAQQNDTDAGNGTYNDIVLKGHTPYKTFTWTINKNRAVYTLTPTVNS
jgi:hypothetical protein